MLLVLPFKVSRELEWYDSLGILLTSEVVAHMCVLWLAIFVVFVGFALAAFFL